MQERDVAEYYDSHRLILDTIVVVIITDLIVLLLRRWLFEVQLFIGLDALSLSALVAAFAIYRPILRRRTIAMLDARDWESAIRTISPFLEYRAEGTETTRPEKDQPSASEQ